jgi:hypothetical protein
MREDGCEVDRLLVTTDSSYVPPGYGPDESPRIPSVEGDLDLDGDVDLADYEVFEAALGGPGIPAAGSAADLNDDGLCDLADWLIFARNFSGAA